MRRESGILGALALVMLLGVFLLFAPLACASKAHADDSDSLSAAASSDIAQDDGEVKELLREISAKLDSVMTSQDSDGLKKAVEAIAPMDNTQRIDSMNHLLSDLSTVSVFQWVTSLLLVGVLLALVFLVSYRSHT